METFAKEHKLVKLFWELKSTPMMCHKKSAGFSSMFVTLNLLFWWFAAKQHVNGCFFANIGVFLYWPV